MNRVFLKIGLRNLLRQKRRNLLLGAGIALGVALLVVANALGNGMMDMLLNKMVSTFSGHIFIKMSERNAQTWEIMRDQARIRRIIEASVEGEETIRENVEANGRALGIGKATYISVNGIEADEAFVRDNAVLQGDLSRLTDSAIENPLALYAKMAKRLNVQVNDVIQMRFESVYGQSQAVQFTVVAILKAPNPFFDRLTFCHKDRLKVLLDLEPQETTALTVVLPSVTNPQRIIEQANRLHQALQPGVAGYEGQIDAQGKSGYVHVLAIAPDAAQQLAASVSLRAGSLPEVLADEHAVLLSETMAIDLGVTVGDEVNLSYQTKFHGQSNAQPLRVGGIFAHTDLLDDNMAVVHPFRLYDTVFAAPPQTPIALSRTSSLFSIALKEWNLLDRTFDAEGLDKKNRLMNVTDWRGITVDVQTIHEKAAEVIDFSNAIKIVTIIGGGILFLIIQFGMINTLQMAIRERTREIGTVRAIGMQRRDVLRSLLVEVALLTLIASCVGICLGLFGIALLAQIPIDSGDSDMGFFLSNQRLHCTPNIQQIALSVAIIFSITLFTAYFPSRKASRLSAVEALRHYE